MKNIYAKLQSTSRIYWLKTILALAFFYGIITSWNLWLTERAFPLVPLFDIAVIPPPFDLLVLIAFLFSLIYLVFSKQVRHALILTLSLGVVIALGDQLRWHPWVYQYLLMMGMMLFFSWHPSDKSGEEQVLSAIGILMASIYVWSGLQKLNTYYLEDVVPFLFSPVFRIFTQQAIETITPFFILTAIIETLVGVGLLFKRTRNVAIVAAIGIHLFILLRVASFWGHWDNILWPWNILMIFAVILLFAGNRLSFKTIVLKDVRTPLKSFALVVFFLPALSFINLWDVYLSWNMYSQNYDQAEFLVSPSLADKLPIGSKKFLHQDESGFLMLDIMNWTIEELDVTLYTEARVYRSLASTLCSYAKDSEDDLRLHITERYNILSQTQRRHDLTCPDLTQ